MTARGETHLLSGAYALDAVTPQEAQAIEAAMAESEELRGEIVGLVDTAVTLGLALPPVAPPAALRASVLSAIDSVPQLPAEATAVDDSDSRPPRLEPSSGTAHVAPRRRPRMMRRPRVLLASAAVAVLLFGGGVLLTRAIVEPQLEYSRIAAAADTRTVTADVVGGGQATVRWSRSEGATAVALEGVKVPSGHVLQLWRVRGGAISSEGLYQGGQFQLLHGVPAAGERLAVSIEPAGGSEQPTTDPIVRMPLTV